MLDIEKLRAKWRRNSLRYKRRHGSPGWRPFEEKFWSQVNKTKTCWLWTGLFGSNKKFAYGKVWYKNAHHAAHRVSWMLLRGPIPDGKLVLHHCDIPACVRPEHLFIGTYVDNMQDMISKGRAAWQKK